MAGSLDAIVVGAGPAGSTAALLLARRGLRITLVDKSIAPPEKICGEYLSPGTMRLLDLIGAGKKLLQLGARPVRGMVIHTRRGSTLRAAFPREPEVPGLAIPRRLLDPLLLELAVKSGAAFEPGMQVSDLLWRDGRVAGVKASFRGRPVRLESRVVIGADGRASVVARRLGRVKRHRWLDRMALAGYFTGVERSDDMGEVFLGRDRYSILNPIAPGLTNAALVVSRREFSGGARDVSIFLKAIRSLHRDLPGRFSRARAVSPIRALGPLAHRASTTGTGGALLVGDAAGFLDPFTGEGIYTALRSAELAAGFAGKALAGDGPEHPDLACYGRAWSREFLPKWRICTILQHAIRRPFLAEWMVSRLASRPVLTSRIMAAVGDLLPAGELGWRLIFCKGG